MPNFDVLEPAIDPANKITFLLDWELTMKCNLDCTYCGSGPTGSHDNSTQHPPLERCLKSIDFMFEYADLYMQYKPAGLKYVILNVYGGEGLYHPNIVEILTQVREKYKKYQHKWQLSVTSTTNLILSSRQLDTVIPLIDEFTATFHAEATAKQQQVYKDNILKVKNSGKRLKAIVMMHNRPDLFEVSEQVVSWLKYNDIACLPKQIDWQETKMYNQHQIIWFNNKFKSKGLDKLAQQAEVDLSDSGRACCGGRKLCQDNDRKQSLTYILDNKFAGWSCSVNWFFLFVKQLDESIYLNKDCKMTFDQTVGPIGYLDHGREILDQTKAQLENKTLPTVICAKSKCFCGLCAPKAATTELYQSMIKKYTKGYYQ